MLIQLVTLHQGWGKTIVLGVDRPDAMLQFRSVELLVNGKTISGSLFGGLKPKSDIPILVKKYMDKVYRYGVGVGAGVGCCIE